MHRNKMAAAVAALAMAAAAAASPLPHSKLNASEIAWLEEDLGVFVGSPSVVEAADGALVASHDYFTLHDFKPAWYNPPFSLVDQVTVYRSTDGGQTWQESAQVVGVYWATLFRRGDQLFLIGTSNNGAVDNSVSVCESTDHGVSWSACVPVLDAGKAAAFSTGPTPVLESGGRLWRAFESNPAGGSWGVSYSGFLVSAPVGANLLNASSWVASNAVAFFDAVREIPAEWTSPYARTNGGWLEGNAVELPGSGGGVGILLRVDSLPAPNVGALLVPDPTDREGARTGAVKLSFSKFVSMPGGLSKFTVRRHPGTGLYVTLSNFADTNELAQWPACFYDESRNTLLPSAADRAAGVDRAAETLDLAEQPEAPSCCPISATHACPSYPCVWCHGNSRNNLTLSTSKDLVNWTVGPRVMYDDSGNAEWMSRMQTGFQYADWHFAGAQNETVRMAVRAGYRGANSAHNANRLLYKEIQWASMMGIKP